MDDFQDFYAARKDHVFRAIVVACGDPSRAEDAVAEAFTRAYSRWSQLCTHPNPTAWVIRTALNVRRSWWRRLRRERFGLAEDRADPAAFDEAGGPGGTAPDDATLDGDVRRLVEALPRRQREVVALRVLADLTPADTAQVLGIAPATVAVHLHRALATLRQQLTDRSEQIEGSL